MKCQEEMELMQRHVDHDLNEQETSALMAHVGQCPECAAMLDKLVQLSQGLEQLPRVTPPYSLVDSILPQLDQEVSGREEAASQSSDNRGSMQSRRAWMTRLSGLIAAGAAVALLFIFNPLSPNISNTNQQEAASAPQSAGESQVAEIADGPTYVAATDQSGSSNGAAPAENWVEAKISDQLQESGIIELPNAQQGPAQRTSDTGSGSGSASSAGNFANREGQTKEGQEMSAMDANVDNMLPNADQQVEAGLDGPVSMTGFISEPEEQISPDGVWRAVLTNGALQIYLVSDGSLAFDLPAEDGSRSDLVWNEDSTGLRYRFIDAEGRESKRKLLVPEMIEQPE